MEIMIQPEGDEFNINMKQVFITITNLKDFLSLESSSLMKAFKIHRILTSRMLMSTQ